MVVTVADDVKVPGVGEVPKVAVFGGVGVVLVLVILYYRSHGSSTPAAAAAASTTDQYPPDGTSGNPADPNSTDPTTGVTYGNEGIGSGAVTSAYGLTGGTGSFGSGEGLYPWDGTTGNPSDPYSMDPSTGVTYGNEGSQGTGAPAGPPFGTNAEWSQYAENYLTSTVGEDAGTVAAALGAYLGGQQVTPAQKDIIDQAVAFAGNPPVTGAGGYPPSIRLASSPAGNGTVTVPNVVGRTDGAYAEQLIRDAGLSVRIESAPGAGATLKGNQGTVTAQSPPAGSHVQKGTMVTLTYKLTPTVKVPSVTGRTDAATAEQIIRAAGLNARVEKSPGTGATVRGNKGRVTAQSPAAGTPVARGTMVTLTYR